MMILSAIEPGGVVRHEPKTLAELGEIIAAYDGFRDVVLRLMDPRTGTSIVLNYERPATL